jgi:hypothetical protein
MNTSVDDLAIKLRALPSETIENIIIQLDPSTIMQLCPTSAPIRDLCLSDVFWQKYIKLHFNDDYYVALLFALYGFDLNNKKRRGKLDGICTDLFRNFIIEYIDLESLNINVQDIIHILIIMENNYKNKIMCNYYLFNYLINSNKIDPMHIFDEGYLAFYFCPSLLKIFLEKYKKLSTIFIYKIINALKGHKYTIYKKPIKEIMEYINNTYPIFITEKH